MLKQNDNPVFIYHYNREDYFFTGTDYADPCPLTGKPLLPAFATFIEPPRAKQSANEIAVFSAEEQKWVVKENKFWHPRLVKREIRLNHQLSGDLSIRQIPMLHNKKNYRGINGIVSPAAISISFSGRLHYISRRAKEIEVIYSQRHLGLDPVSLQYLKITSEDLVAQMKRFIDDVFVHEWIELERESIEFKEKRVIGLQAVNEVDSLKESFTKEKLKKMKDEDAEFFKLITDLRNSFAHHLPVAETFNLVGMNHPTINTIYTSKGNLNKIELIEVYVEDLTRSFNKFLERTFDL